MDMTQGSLWDKIILYALPLMLTNVLQLLYNAADNVVVGRYAADPDTALAAVSSNGSLINLIVNLFIGLSVGTTVAVANHRGAHRSEDIRSTVHTSIAVSIVGGTLLLIAGMFITKPLLRLMQCPEKVLDLAALYLKIYFAGMPFNMAFNFGAAVLRAVGDTRRPLYILTLSGLVNVLLNLFFVVVLHIDVAGVALATVISQVISAVLVLMCLIKEDGDIHLDMRRLRIEPSRLGELAKFGLPAGLQGTLFSLSNVVIQSSINAWGADVMTGNGIAANVEGFLAAFQNSFYQSSLTFAGQNYGAKKYSRIKYIILFCMGYMVVISTGLGALISRFAEPILRIYRPDASQSVLDAGMVRMDVMIKWYFMCGVMDIMCGALRGMGKTVSPMIISLMGACGFRLLWIATYHKSHRSLTVLYNSYPISWTLVSVVYVCMLAYLFTKLKRIENAGTELRD